MLNSAILSPGTSDFDHYLCKISKTFGVVVEVILKKGTVEVSISDRASRVLLVKKRGAIGPFRNKFETDFKERDDCLDRFHAPEVTFLYRRHLYR